jgi:hypothetical protein
VGLVTLVPLLYLAEELPMPPDMLAFVVPALHAAASASSAQHEAEPVKPKAVPKMESAT